MMYNMSISDWPHSTAFLPASNMWVDYSASDAESISNGKCGATAFAMTLLLIGATSIDAPKSSGVFSLIEYTPSASAASIEGELPLSDSIVEEQAVSTFELVDKLREGGIPIATIAEMVNVERKTIYSWLKGTVEADSRNFLRLRTVSDLFTSQRPGSMKFYNRMWKREMPDGTSLQSVMCAERLDVEQARRIIDWLRPAVEKSVRRDERQGYKNPESSASHLTIDLVAVG